MLNRVGHFLSQGIVFIHIVYQNQELKIFRTVSYHLRVSERGGMYV